MLFDLRVFHFEGLEDGNLVLRGELLDGRFGEFLSASLRPVRLRDHADHGVIRMQERRKRRDGKLRCSHEDDAHALC